MPLNLFRLPCGVIYTDTFAHWLAQRHAEEVRQHPRQMLTLDYVRCSSGEKKGSAWWQLLWTPEDMVPPHRRFKVNDLPVYLPKASQHGLRERCLDCDEGRVVVRP